MTEDRELVEKLLRGQAAIDRMKAEIKQVVPIILGIAGMYEKTHKLLIHNEFTSGAYRWNISSNPREGLLANCWHFYGSGRELIYQSWDERDVPLLSQVVLVYESLPVLLGGMLRAYPQMVAHYQPLLDLADYFPPQQR